MPTLVHPDLPGQFCERDTDDEVNALARSGWHVASEGELAALTPADDVVNPAAGEAPTPDTAQIAEQPARRTSKKEQ